MRFALAAGVWAVILILLFTVFSSRNTPADSARTAEKEHSFSISFEITTTFAVEKDPFAVDLGEENHAFTLVLDGREIFSASEGISDRATFSTEETELTEGSHELFVSANPAETGLSNAVHIRVLSSGNPVSDETFWFSPGQSVTASHIFTLEERDSHE